ncbi:MAG TPA: helix-turn-helix domain-containing protein [Geopsychrobacteraceae bacterium]|nr:helix-turn-helix domain-containing protein [Geopsychrobacteraceae bacterium]
MDSCQPLGEYLREKRLEKGLALKDIALRTKVTLTCLQALEDGHYHKLPAETYLKGYLASYAESLDVPAQKVLELYRSERSERSEPSSDALVPPESADHRKPFVTKRRTPVLLVSVLSIILAGTVFWWLAGDNGTQPAEAPVPVDSVQVKSVEMEKIFTEPVPGMELPFTEKTADNDEQIDASEPTMQNTAVEPQGSLAREVPLATSQRPDIPLPAVMELEALQPVSVAVTIDERPFKSYTLQAGSLLRWRIKNSVELQTEKSDAVQATIGGIKIVPDAAGRFVLPFPDN